MNGSPLSALSATNTTPVTFNYENTLSSEIEFEYGLITTRAAGCFVFDTVKITIFPDQSSSLSSDICAPILNCGPPGQSGFGLTGPVNGTNYDWNIISGDLTAMIDDESDPLANVTSGINQTTVFELSYTDNNGCPTTFTQTVNTINCACTELGDTVWYDLNLDGLQDIGEPGIPGVTVYLYDASDLNTPLQITVTDRVGYYIFSPLSSGNYVVRFDQTTQTGGFHQLIPTVQNAGNDERDSDADTLTGYTGSYFIANGLSDYTVDAGFVPAFDLALTKSLDPSRPTGPFFVGDTVYFEILLYNQGGFYGAQDVEITDYGHPDLTFVSVNEGATVSNNGISSFITNNGGGVFTIDTLAPVDTLSLIVGYEIDPSFSGTSITNYAEISDYSNSFDLSDIDSDADGIPNNDAGGLPNSDTDNSIDGDGSGTFLNDDASKDEDDHDPAVFQVSMLDLALQKRLDESFNASPVDLGELVKFDITVINQGNLSVDSVLVADYVPAGFSFYDTIPQNMSEGWRSDSTAMVRSRLNSGDRATISIYLVAEFSNYVTDFYNYSEIVAAYDTLQGIDVAHKDIDSQPGSNSSAENGVLPNSPGDDNISSTGINQVGSEDDHDVAGCEIQYVDVALRKTLDPSVDLSSIRYGDTLKYLFQVFNQGSLYADTIYITEYLPAGLGFDATIPANSSWTQDNDSTLTGYLLNVQPMDSTNACLWLTFEKGNDPDDWTNHAEISRFIDIDGNDRSSEDIDSPLNDDRTDNGGGAVNSDADNEINGNGTGPIGGNTAATDQDNADPHKISFVDLAQIKELLTSAPYKYGDTLRY